MLNMTPVTQQPQLQPNSVAQLQLIHSVTEPTSTNSYIPNIENNFQIESQANHVFTPDLSNIPAMGNNLPIENQRVFDSSLNETSK